MYINRYIYIYTYIYIYIYIYIDTNILNVMIQSSMIKCSHQNFCIFQFVAGSTFRNPAGPLKGVT